MQKPNLLIPLFLLALAAPCLAQDTPAFPQSAGSSAPRAQMPPPFPQSAGSVAPPAQTRPPFPQSAGSLTARPQESAPAQYRLNPGDTLELDFRLSPELNQTVVIDPDGTVGLLVIGRIHLAGLTLPEARQALLAKESEHLLKPEINLQLTNYQHLYVVVAGEVYLPQRIEMREPMTALQALTLAGGFRSTGRETSVLLYRRVNDEIAEVYKLNLKIKKNAQIENDMRLQPGDLLVVQRSKVESVARFVRVVGLSYPIITPY